MQEKLQPFSVVRIRVLLDAKHNWFGETDCGQLPQVGDVRTVMDVLHAKGLPDKFPVELVETDGTVRWLCDFLAEELEILSREELAVRKKG